jgi:hypothetical protein
VIKKLVTESAPDEIVIVHGNCRGVDRSFRSACEFMGVKHEPHDVSPETWKKVGKGAGPARNTEMVKLGADVCLVFHPDLVASKGSRDCATKSLAAGILVRHCYDGYSLNDVTEISDLGIHYKGDEQRFGK